MGLFSSKPKATPTIISEGIKIVFQDDYVGWEFTYHDTVFSSHGDTLALPTKAELDAILETVESLKPEMRSRMGNELKEFDAKLDDGESCLINVQDYVAEKSFTVTWLGGESWGDMGVDFTIKDGAILDESWGD